jgi:hypothetical protein
LNELVDYYNAMLWVVSNSYSFLIHGRIESNDFIH